LSDEQDPPEDTPSDTPPERPQFDGPSISVEEEMKTSFLDYSMSVIVSRAIPDLRDGLKPVHRRILFGMSEGGYDYNKPYKKSARLVGDVMGKYHPHGDTAIYDAMVRMAQDFSMSVMLADGQGNFGSMDGDNPAAMRYTEVRMAKVAEELLKDLDKNTVDFQPNYSNEFQEPMVLPARFPNLLVNGSQGIAVGMATNIPPHNLGEIIDGTLALIDNPDLEVSDLMEYIPGPDFPTGGLMLGQSGARKAYMDGRGSIMMRAKTSIEEIRKDRYAIVMTEIPYQMNKGTLEARINELVKEKKVEGVADVRDESNRHGVRFVVELKRDATAEVVLNQLFRFTPMQTSFGANMLALNNGRPEQMDLKRILSSFIAFREEVIARRTAFDLNKARERAHILCGLAVAVENIDEVVALIRGSADAGEAREKLMGKDWPATEIAPYIKLIDDPTHTINDDGSYRLSEIQARAILDLRLQRLTALGVEEITNELKELAEKIIDFLDILGSRERILAIISEEMTAVKDEFAVPRRTEIVESLADFDDEDLIEPEDMVVTATHSGYVKRTPLAEYRSQKRGGKGLMGMSTKDEDFVTRLFSANTLTPVLFFTTDGIVYKLKTWRLPQGGRNAKGKALVNLLPIEPGVSIAAMMPVDAPEEEWSNLQIVFCTSDGQVRRNELSDFVNVKANGKIAMKLPEDVRLISAQICSPDNDVLLSSKLGKAIRFPIDSEVRVFKGRDSTGVRGMKLTEGDEIVSMCVLQNVDRTTEEARAYLKMRRQMAGDDDSGPSDDDEDVADTAISQERYIELGAQEEFILTVAENGIGKRTSSYEYRPMRRGGQGVTAMALSANKKGGATHIVATFPVEEGDQCMLVTDTGQSIRCGVSGVSVRSRSAGGVWMLRTAEEERVVSVARLAEQSDDEEGEDGNAGGAPTAEGETPKE